MTWRQQTKDDFQPALDRADGMRFHHDTQCGAQFKTYELLVSGILFDAW